MANIRRKRDSTHEVLITRLGVSRDPGDLEKEDYLQLIERSIKDRI